ncbi:MAG: hypothetical protein SGARI_002488 [Bacillariaceae sp.]
MLCCNHWGQDTAEDLLEVTQIPPKAYFTEFGISSFVDKAYEEAALPELQYTPRDYVLILEVWNSDVNKIVHSVAIPGEDLPSFFQEGKASVTLKKPVHNILFEDVGKRFSLVGHGPLVDDNQEDVKSTFRTSLKLMRKPDRKVLEIHDRILEACSFDKDFGESDKFYIEEFRSVIPNEELLFAHVLETVLPWDGALAQPVKQRAI